MAVKNWAHDVFGKDVSIDGSIVQPRRGRVNFVSGAGVALSGADNPTTESTDITVGNASDDNWWDPVRAATTANITLSGLQTIDGVTLNEGDRVLVKDQATGADNGIRIASSGAWVRAVDADTNPEVVAGKKVYVQEGTASLRKTYSLTTPDPISLGTTALTFTLLQLQGDLSGSLDAAVVTGLRGLPLDPASFGAAKDGDYPYFDAAASDIKLGKTFISTQGRLADDGTDQRANLQALIDEAQPNGAEVVIHPTDNGYTFTDATTIILRPHVTLRGSFRGQRRGLQLYSVGDFGSLFLVRQAAVNFMELQHNVTVDGLEIFYPDQVTTGTPTAYPWTFEQSLNSHAATIRNVACPNPYQFLRVEADGTLLENIYGYPLSVGIDMVRCAEVFRAVNVHFSGNCFPSLDPSLTAWVLANADAIKVTGPEEFILTNFFCFGYNRALWFTGAGSFHGVYGQWHGGGADQCNVPILISNEGLTSRGFKMVGVNLIPHQTGVLFADTGGATGTPTEDEHPQVIMTDCNMWNGGGYDRPVWFQASSHGRLIVDGGRWRDSNNEGAGLIESSDAMVRTFGLGVPAGTGNSWRWRDTSDAADVQEHGIHD